MDYLEDPMKRKFWTLALSLLPLALVVGCEKKAEEPAVTEEAAPATTEATPAEGEEVAAPVESEAATPAS